MRKKLVIVLAVIVALGLGLSACKAPAAAAPEQAPATETTAPAATEAAGDSVGHKVIGYYKDAADDFYKQETEALMLLAEDAGYDWEFIDVVGQGTAPEQVAAVENFITNKVDAIVVIPNSPSATTECIEKANSANVPYFAVTHSFTLPSGMDLAGFVGYDYVETGIYAGEDALARGVKKLIMIEGKLGQGTAGAQSTGFIKAYVDAGKDVGDAWDPVAGQAVANSKGGADLEIVYWGSGDWFAVPAKDEMSRAMVVLGNNDWDGAYVQNDEMMDGALQAVEEAGLDPSDYWFGSSNGKEKSWDWVRAGRMTMDVNQTPTLEGLLVFRQLEAYFSGQDYRKYVSPYLTPYNVDNIESINLIPYNPQEFLKGYKEGKWVTDINDAKFKDASYLLGIN